MTDKIIFLLEELKEKYTHELLQQTLHCFRDEISINDLLKDKDRIKIAVNGQTEQFYNELAFDFVQDLNEVPEMYFLIWEVILYFFDRQTSNYFYKTALEISHNTDATDFINGLLELEKGNSEIALYNFNRIDNYVACYFIAICYLAEENYENSLKQNQIFLNNLDSAFQNKEEIDISQDDGISVLKWNIFNDLGYAYNKIYEFQNAVDSYKNSLNIFNIEDSYNIKHSIMVDEKLDEFTVFANNYLFALEKTANYSDCLKVINFMIEKYPRDFYYVSKKKKLEFQNDNKVEGEWVFNQIFKPKKPIDINFFQATKLISKEKNLEEMILEQIKYGFKVFNKCLELYEDEFINGRQYVIPEINGRLDLLLIDKTNDQLYIVELKRNGSGIEVVEQIENYMTVLSNQLNKKINGIICLHKTNTKLTELVQTKENIELYTYNFEFTKEV